MRKTNKEYLKKFYENLPEEKKHQVCPDCGQTYSYMNKSKHRKTKIHLLISEDRKINIEKNA